MQSIAKVNITAFIYRTVWKDFYSLLITNTDDSGNSVDVSTCICSKERDEILIPNLYLYYLSILLYDRSICAPKSDLYELWITDCIEV